MKDLSSVAALVGAATTLLAFLFSSRNRKSPIDRLQVIQGLVVTANTAEAKKSLEEAEKTLASRISFSEKNVPKSKFRVLVLVTMALLVIASILVVNDETSSDVLKVIAFATILIIALASGVISSNMAREE